MAVVFSKAQETFICATGDTKPTAASHSGIPLPQAGDYCWVYDENKVYRTYDGTNWILYATMG